MAIQSAGDIKIGDLIQHGRGGATFYVHEIERVRDGEGIDVVRSFITLPVVSDTNALSGTRIVPVAPYQIRERDRSITLPDNAHISVGLHATRKIDVDPEQYLVKLAGKTDAEIIEAVNNAFEEIGAHHARISDLPTSEVSIRGQSFENYTGGRVIGEGKPVDDRIKKTRKPKKKKAATLVNVPDIYLEDACKLGFITRETYLTLTKDRDIKEIITLREALALTQSEDGKALNDYIDGESFDDIFPAENREKIDDVAVLRNAVVAAVSQDRITLHEALERKLLRDSFTVEALSNQGDLDSDEYDERVILDLEEAFRLVAVDPEYLAEYDSPTSTRQVRKLSPKQQAKIIEDVKHAFNILSVETSLKSVKEDIESGYRRFMGEYTTLVNEGKAFTRHDPALEVVEAYEDKRVTETTKIRNMRPDKLNFG